MELKFSIEGAEPISRNLGEIANGVKDFKKPFEDVSKAMLKTFQMNFDSRGSLYGGWAARKPQYKGGVRIDTWPLMEKTGRMRRSFKSDVRSTSIELYNTRSYFKYHQSNAPRTSNLPRRAMMKLRRQDADMVVRQFQLYLIDIQRKSGVYGRSTSKTKRSAY